MTRSACLFLALFFSATAFAQWPAPQAPVIPDADGYVVIPQAAVTPQKDHVYKAVFNATAAASEPTGLLPALNNAGAEINALAVCGIPQENQKFAVVFHGPAIDGILSDEHYRRKYHTANPNLAVLRQMKEQGVELFVCGQNLALARIDPATLAPEVAVASDALIVLMTYQNLGYTLLEF